MADPRNYFLFGLHVRSELPLPELPVAKVNSEPDVNIRHGMVPSTPGDETSAEATHFEVEGVARYAISKGSEITVQREQDVPDANVRLYLLGSAMGVLLHQRGLLPLHANTVQIGHRAFAFMGPSGAGKSTLAAWFHDRGYRVIGDDVCVVRFGNGEPLVAPGISRLRLWRETLEQTGRDASEFSRSYSGDDLWDKFDVPLSYEDATLESFPLGGIYVLDRGDETSITRMSGVRAVETIAANTYRGHFVSTLGVHQTFWDSCLSLSSSVPIFRLARPWDLASGEGMIPKLVAHAEALDQLLISP